MQEVKCFASIKIEKRNFFQRTMLIILICERLFDLENSDNSR